MCSSFRAHVHKCGLYSISFQVLASDPDCGLNAVLSYSLEPGTHLREFRMVEATGELCLQGPLDRETRDSYEFPVLATDGGQCQI